MDYPKVVGKKLFSDGVDLTLEMDPELDAFKGHFAIKPIVPGVVQIQWAIKFASLYIDELSNIEVEQLNALKFYNIISPATVIDLKLRLVNEKLEFSYFSSELKHSSGRIFIH